MNGTTIIEAIKTNKGKIVKGLVIAGVAALITIVGTNMIKTDDEVVEVEIEDEEVGETESVEIDAE